MLNELKRLNLDGADLETLVSMAAFARNLQSEYVHRNVPTPEWLDNKNRELTREITRRTSDDLERELKAIQAQQATLMTAAEKREQLTKREAELKAKLGMTAPAPTP